MRSVVTNVVRAVGGWLLWVRDQLTPGQRWTAALGLGYAVVLLLVGLPTAVDVTDGASSGPRRPSATFGSAEDGSGASAPSPPPLGSLTSAPASVATAVAGAPSAPASSGPTLAPAGVTTIAAVLLARTGEGVVGRDDAAMGAAFFGATGVPYRVVPFDPADPRVCEEVVSAGNVAVAAADLGAPLRDCLVAAGVNIVAYDALGSRPPASPAGGQVLATRRGVRASLVDLGRWGRAHGALRGRIGVVGLDTLRAEIDEAVRRLRGIGVDVVATRFLPPGQPGVTDVPGGVLAFQTAGVQAVIFATSVDHQRAWVALQQMVDPGVRFVVSDAAGAIVDETYPPTFDGALAHTSLRFPWWSRSHPDTPEQTRCRQAWAQAAPPGALDSTELARAFVWCESAALVMQAASAVAGGTPATEALANMVLPSPLTSDLGPLPDGGVGPREDAVLIWKAACTCWREQRWFEARAGS